MDVTPIIPSDRQVIQAYGGGTFRISGEVFQGAVLVFPDRVQSWGVAGMDEVSVDSLRPVIEEQPPVELLLLGCGPRMQLVPARLRQALREAGVVIEAMDTGSACRTYMVLLAEARRVAAALLPV